MEIDTSACKTVMHKLVYNRKFSNVQLNDPHFKLTSVYGENLSILGTFNCTVVRNDIKRKLPAVLFEYGQKSILNLVSSEGLKPVKEKIKAILDAPSPTSVTPLKSYLGLLNYGKFLPRLCEEYDLLKVDTPFKWSKYCQNAFEKSKTLLTENSLLVHYNPTKQLFVTCDASNADALSRLPLQQELDIPDQLNSYSFEATVPLSHREISIATEKDSLLLKIKEFVLKGWPYKITDGQKPYFKRRTELTVEQGCILWGTRIVIPESMQQAILKLFDEGHNGIVYSKMLVRNTASKWLDVHIMSGTNALQTVETLCKTFAIVGFPFELVSDNGPHLSSSEFVKFLQENGINPPYYPQSNGIAERHIQTIKKH
ncbi:hypothetical protein HUJ05_001723 [Dendroctonus ponderosae]|nr:hypothetical protein HUJ05_001723 [Dendroctonus ponderosae]